MYVCVCVCVGGGSNAVGSFFVKNCLIFQIKSSLRGTRDGYKDKSCCCSGWATWRAAERAEGELQAARRSSRGSQQSILNHQSI